LPRRAVRAAAAGLGVAALFLIPGLSFDVNPLNLQDENAESVQALRTLMAGDGREIWAAASIAKDAEQAKARAVEFDSYPEVDRVVSMLDFVPPDQEQRLEIIGDIAAALEPDPFASAYDPPDVDAQRAGAAALARALGRLVEQGAAPDGIVAMSAALDRLAEASADMIAKVETGLVGALPGRLAALEQALDAEMFDLDDLPDEVIARYRGTDGALRLDIHPTRDITADNAALAEFVAAIRVADSDVTDDPILVLEAGNVMIQAFAQALISALVVIAIIIYVVTRRLGDVALIITPLCLAGLLTGAAMRLIGLEFNFANVIVLPLLLGIGVDSAIHLVHRHRAQPDRRLGETSTVSAILFSALTTMAGFGSLALSPHPGTASMGLLLLLGVTLTVACTLVLIPALLPMRAAQAEPNRS
jgi:hopanoid biosynthesis associated RND transporter like protein HpnN